MQCKKSVRASAGASLMKTPIPKEWSEADLQQANQSVIHYIKNQITNSLFCRVKGVLDKLEAALQYKGDSAKAKWMRIIHSITYDGETEPEKFIEEFDCIVERVQSVNPRFDQWQEKYAFMMAI